MGNDNLEKSKSNQILSVCLHQLRLFCLSKEEEESILEIFDEAMDRAFYCFSNTAKKYYGEKGEVIFSPWHSGQWCIFLYYLSNSCQKVNPDAASKIYYLNKMLNSVDLFHEVELPDVFRLDHPMGAVIGKAKYGNNFFFCQGCTVGNNKGVYPLIGENVSMFSNSKILGSCHIGDSVIISANSYIKDEDVPENMIVFGSSPNLTFSPLVK